MSYFANLSQNISVDSNNSSNVNLGSNVSFVGVATQTLGVSGIQVSLKTDQNCTIYVSQSPGIFDGIGTVTTNGSKTLTGSNTKFTRDLMVGDQIWVNTETVRIIESIASDISLNVTSVFNTSTSGLSFTQHYWDMYDSYDYHTNINNFGVTVQAINSYVRVKVTNIDHHDTTYFRLQTVLCPIIESVPRSLDEDGNFKVGIKSFKDQYGFEAENTSTSELRVVEPVRLVGAQFEGTTIDPNFWSTAADATAQPGSVTQSGTSIILSSGTNASAFSKLWSIRRSRYVGGSSMRYRQHVRLGDTGTANNTRRWGVAWSSTTMPSITDGAWFELSGTTFSVVTMKGGSVSRVSSGSFNGNNGLTYSPGLTNTVYEIYISNGSVIFVAGDVLHTVTASSTTWTNTLSLHIYNDNFNSNTLSGAVQLYSRTASIYRMGKLETATQWKYIHGINAGTVLKYGAGRLHKVILNAQGNNSTISLYDGITATNPIALVIPTNIASPIAIDYGLDFYTGLYVVTANSSTDVTIIYE